MPLVRDRCICLRKVEYSETSQILSLFARDQGLFRAIAKGAHRRTKAGASKFDGGVDLLDLGEAVFTHDPARDLATLTEWHLIDGHLQLRDNLRAIYLAQYAAELVGSLLEEHDAHAELFDRLEHLLDDLPTATTEESFLAFQLDLLRETGYLPSLDGCVSCGIAMDLHQPTDFSPARGGVLCSVCAAKSTDRFPFDPRLLRLVQSIIRLPRSNGVSQPPRRLPRLTRHQTDPLNLIFARHIQHTLSRALRGAQYVLP